MYVLSACIYISLSIRPSMCPSIRLSVYPFIHLTAIHPFILSSVCILPEHLFHTQPNAEYQENERTFRLYGSHLSGSLQVTKHISLTEQFINCMFKFHKQPESIPCSFLQQFMVKRTVPRCSIFLGNTQYLHALILQILHNSLPNQTIFRLIMIFSLNF